MAANPITWTEINAFSSGCLAGMSVWEKRLIRRIDDAILAIWAAAASGAPANQISVKDPKSIKALLRRFAADREYPADHD